MPYRFFSEFPGHMACESHRLAECLAKTMYNLDESPADSMKRYKDAIDHTHTKKKTLLPQ